MTRKLSRAHQMMVEDGAPLCILATPENQRRSEEAWRKFPPRAIPFAEVKVTRNEDADTTAFRAAEDERRRQKSLAQIGKMKARLAAKASKVDYSKTRWDPRKSKFVEDNGTTPNPVLAAEPVTRSSGASRERKADRSNREFKSPDRGQLTKDNAETIARLNGVWKDSYEKLRGTGRIVMTVGNVLKGLVQRGGEVRWN